MPDIQCLSCGTGIYLEDTTYANYQGRIICPDCRGHQDVVIQRKQLITANLISDIYEPIRDILAWEIPTDILLDLAEAAIDLGVNAYKSCVVMCRRCVQAVLLDKGIKDDTLENMIDRAKSTELGPGHVLLSENLYQTAKAVRFFGNSGAHPLDPVLRAVGKLQAQLGLQVTKEILQWVYPLKPDDPEQLALEEQ